MDQFFSILKKALKSVSDFTACVAKTTAKTLAKGTEKAGSLVCDKLCKEIKAHSKEVSKGVMIGAGAVTILAAAAFFLRKEE